MDWSESEWRQLTRLCVTCNEHLIPQNGGGVEFLTIRVSKHSQHYAPHYSVHKYIYRSCMSGTSNITLL